LRSKQSRNILFLSDLHVGSEYAVCSPNPTLGGGSYNPNKLQKKLYDIWCNVRDKCTKPHILVLNGEPCDGSNPKQQGQQSWNTVIREQLDDAGKLLRMYKPKYFLMTRGSNYHVQLGADNQEEQLAERLHAVPYSGYLDRGSVKVPAWDKNRNESIYTDYYLTFSVHGKVFSVTHHIGFNRWFAYRTTALAREMADMEFLRGRYWDNDHTPTVIVRSHVHYFVMVRFATQFGFTTPAFKMPDSHLFRGGLGGTAPSLGTVEVIVEPNGHILIEPHIVSNTDYPKHKILDLTN
jgi:hypothetical protein